MAELNRFWIQGTGTALPHFLEWSLEHLKPGSTDTVPRNSWADLGVNTCQGAFLSSSLNVTIPVGIRPYIGCYKMGLSIGARVCALILSWLLE